MPKQDNVAVVAGGGGFALEVHPPFVGSEHRGTVRLSIVSKQGNHLTGAGVAAVLGVLNSYLTSSKATAIITRAGAQATPQIRLSAAGGGLDILPEDFATLQTSLNGVLSVAANVTTQR